MRGIDRDVSQRSDEKMAIEIMTEEEFKHYKACRGCYIVITDTTRRIIHSTSCPDVSITSFREKVVNNTGKNGQYHFTDDLIEGREKFRAEKCQNCRPK
jgi:hypothetical protein